jgi:hypothetical protein
MNAKQSKCKAATEKFPNQVTEGLATFKVRDPSPEDRFAAQRARLECASPFGGESAVTGAAYALPSDGSGAGGEGDSRDSSHELSIRSVENIDETRRLCRKVPVRNDRAGHSLEDEIRQYATGRFEVVLLNPPFSVNAVDKERLKDSVEPGRRFTAK